jgi:hypothetical protein
MPPFELMLMSIITVRGDLGPVLRYDCHRRSSDWLHHVAGLIAGVMADALPGGT